MAPFVLPGDFADQVLNEYPNEDRFRVGRLLPVVRHRAEVTGDGARAGRQRDRCRAAFPTLRAEPADASRRRGHLYGDRKSVV